MIEGVVSAMEKSKDINITGVITVLKEATSLIDSYLNADQSDEVKTERRNNVTSKNKR